MLITVLLNTQPTLSIYQDARQQLSTADILLIPHTGEMLIVSRTYLYLSWSSVIYYYHSMTFFNILWLTSLRSYSRCMSFPSLLSDLKDPGYFCLAEEWGETAVGGMGRRYGYISVLFLFLLKLKNKPENLLPILKMVQYLKNQGAYSQPNMNME